MDIKFRTLCAQEIDVTVERIWPTGATLMLHKNARVDMNLLDECVGPLNWTREHSKKHPNYCAVSIYDEERKVWIKKEDFGEISEGVYAIKSMASDSFKRCCTNWGIGRQLYSCPQIKLDATNITIREENGKYYTFDEFKVASIEYDKSEKEITGLVIVNETLNKVVYTYGAEQKSAVTENTIKKTDNVAKPVLLNKKTQENAASVTQTTPIEDAPVTDKQTMVISGLTIDKHSENKKDGTTTNDAMSALQSTSEQLNLQSMLENNTFSSSEDNNNQKETSTEKVIPAPGIPQEVKKPVTPVIPKTPMTPPMPSDNRPSFEEDDPRSTLVDIGQNFIKNHMRLGDLAAPQIRWVYQNTKSEIVKQNCMKIAKDDEKVKNSFINGGIPVK